jgi:hypothetical protein
VPSPETHPRRRPPVSHQRYVARRVGVAAVAAVLVFAMVWGLGSALGGDGDGGTLAEATIPATASAGPAAAATAPPEATDGRSADATDPAASAASVPPSSPDTTAAANVPPTSAPVAGAAATPTSATAAGPAPTAAAPARVLVVGDSDAGTFGPYLQMLLDDTEVVQTTVDYKVSSGLSRPDFFDWPGHLRETLPSVDPQIVVVTFGGNDAQGLSVPSGEFVIQDPVGEQEEWQAEYTRRALEVLDLLLENGRTVIWVGIPNDDNPDVTERMAVQDGAARAAVAQRPGVQFVDTWARFSGRSGGWAEYVVDPRDGVGKDVRADDGFHLNETGAEILALDIAEIVKGDLRARGAAI